MQKKPFVSIVIPAYNSEEWLPQCLDSVINQTYRNLQIICINDGSKDNSLAVLLEYSEKDERILVIDQPNMGANVCRNSAYPHIRGKYTLFVDSDDWIELNACEELVQKAEQAGADLVISAWYANSHEIREWTQKGKINENGFLNDKRSALLAVQPWAKLFRSDILLQNDMKFLDGHGSDIIFSYRLAMFADKIAVIPKSFYHIRPVADSLTRLRSRHHLGRIVNVKRTEAFLREHSLFYKYGDVFLWRKWAIFQCFFYRMNTDGQAEYLRQCRECITEEDRAAYRNGKMNKKVRVFYEMVAPEDKINTMIMALKRFMWRAYARIALRSEYL